MCAVLLFLCLILPKRDCFLFFHVGQTLPERVSPIGYLQAVGVLYLVFAEHRVEGALCRRGVGGGRHGVHPDVAAGYFEHGLAEVIPSAAGLCRVPTGEGER